MSTRHRKQMLGSPRPVRRLEQREDERLMLRVTKTIEADLSREAENPQDDFSLGYQHALKSILRLIDAESGKAMRL